MTWVLLVVLAGCSEYNLQGEGWPPAPGEQPDELEPGEIAEEFLQRTAVASDILFIVDDSGSMGGEQDNLSANFHAFSQYLFGSDVDYHIGLLRGGLTGEPYDGVLEPVVSNALRYLDPSVGNGQAVFELAVGALGTDGGSGCESGLMGSYLALTAPNAEPTGLNAGFYRDDAMLTVIVVSDENDNGSLEECEYIEARPENWAPWFGGLKDNPTRLNFGVIAGFDPVDHATPANCNSTGLGDADAAPVYGRARDLVGGLSYSICDPDWSPVLNDLGLAAAGLTRQFNLARVPVWDDDDFDGDGDTDEPVLEVWLDRGNGGLERTEPIWSDDPDPDNPWDYDRALNAVLYTVEDMPEEGWRVLAIYPNSEES